MKLTEDQVHIMEAIIYAIKENSDGHDLIKHIQQLQSQGIDVHEYLEINQPEILTEEDE